MLACRLSWNQSGTNCQCFQFSLSQTFPFSSLASLSQIAFITLYRKYNFLVSWTLAFPKLKIPEVKNSRPLASVMDHICPFKVCMWNPFSSVCADSLGGNCRDDSPEIWDPWDSDTVPLIWRVGGELVSISTLHVWEHWKESHLQNSHQELSLFSSWFWTL